MASEPSATSSSIGNDEIKVLVWVEQKPMAELINLTLNHGICDARDVNDSAAARALLEEWQPELAVIEVEIADEEILQQIQRTSINGTVTLPIIGLTRRGDLKTKLAAFDRGLDDIMSIPFSPEELLARVLALTKRAYGRPTRFNPIIKLGEMEIDILNRHVRVADHELHMTGLEQSLLYYLAANAGRLVTRDEILDAVWGVDFVADSNLVDRHIRNLRAKLQNDWRRPRFIATIPGKGYQFLPTFSGASPAS